MRSFEHIEKIDEERAPSKAKNITVNGSKMGRLKKKKIDGKRVPLKAKSFVVNGSKMGRLKKRWKEIIKKDMLARGLKRGDA